MSVGNLPKEERDNKIISISDHDRKQFNINLLARKIDGQWTGET